MPKIAKKKDVSALTSRAMAKIAKKKDVSASEWLQHGIDAGWCSSPTCDTHDANVMTDSEWELWENGDRDFCICVVRIYNDDDSGAK